MTHSHTARWVIACLAGCAFALGLSPYDLWPCIPLSAGVLFTLLRDDPFATPWRTGLAYGLGFFGVSVSWVYVSIHVYGPTPVWLAALLTALFCGGLALLHGFQASLFYRLGSRHLSWRLIQFASIWVLFEWLRSWLLTGFPWTYAGYSALDSFLNGWIPVIGVYGCSWLVISLGCLWVESLRDPRITSRWIATATYTALLGLGASVWSDTTWTTPVGEPIKVAAVQPNVPLTEKWAPRHRDRILQAFRDTSSMLIEEHDLILWPESALPGYLDRFEAEIDQLSESAAAHNTALITGIPTRDSTGRFNSIIAIGAGRGEYRKQKLVPFGEYVPLEHWLRGVIAFFDLPMSQFTEGRANQPLLMAGDIKIAPYICYEVLYPDFVRANLRDATLLVTISNDTWFGASTGPWQHFQMARFRAVELGRDLVRSTNDGVSALIQADGHIVASTPQFQQSVVTGTLQPRMGQTPFATTGSLPVWVFALITLVLGRDRA